MDKTTETQVDNILTNSKIHDTIRWTMHCLYFERTIMGIEKELNELFLMQQVYSTLFSVYNKVQTESAKCFMKLSSRQYMTMLAIHHLPENDATINSVARKLGTTKQNAKQLITILEKNGYIVTELSNTDRRKGNIIITQSGINEMLKSSEIGIMFLADVFNEFTGDEMQILWELLKKMYRFDGKEQDGFEEDPNENKMIDQASQEVQIKALQAFVEKRKKREGNIHE